MSGPPPLPGGPQRDNALAVIAIVLSCLGFLLGPLAAIPGVICGHIAKSECDRDPTLGGRSMAVAALAVGYVVIALVALAVAVFLAVVAAAAR